MKIRCTVKTRRALVLVASITLISGALMVKAPAPDALAMATMILRPSDSSPGTPVRSEVQPSTLNADAACAEAIRAKEKTFTVLAAGDILLDRTPGQRAEQHGFRYLFEDIKELVSTADIAFANLETPVSCVGVPFPGKPENVTFRSDPATLFGIAWAGFDVLSLANNHINDYGPRAIDETLGFLELLGIQSSGAGRSIEEARKPALLYRDGVRFAFLSYAVPGYSIIGATGSMAGTALTRSEEKLNGPIPAPQPDVNPDSPQKHGTGVALATRETIISDIQKIKTSLDPEYLFVSIHWGDEHQHIPGREQQVLGRAAIDAGATAVLGHHPHVLQSVERYHDGLIIYSLGNFIFDMAAKATFETAAFNLVLSGGKLVRADIIPLRIARNSYAPALATGSDAISRLKNLAKWSARFDTDVEIKESTGQIFF